MKIYILSFLAFIAVITSFCKSNEDKTVIGGKPILLFEKDTLNFGILHKDSIFRGEFKYKNVGTDSLKLIRVQGQCGCTEAYFSKKLLLPNHPGFVAVEYKPNPQDSGLVIKKILIENNTDTIFRTFYLKGIVKR